MKMMHIPLLYQTLGMLLLNDALNTCLAMMKHAKTYPKPMNINSRNLDLILKP